MDFDFSPEQAMLRDTVRKWVRKDYSFERRAGIVRVGGFSAEAWNDLAALGLTGLTIPTEHGGLSGTAIDAMVVMEELGRGLVLEPFAQVCLVATALLDAGHSPSASLWLRGMAQGTERVVLAHHERGARYQLAHVETRAEIDHGTWRISGHKSLVPAAAHAGAFIVPARTSGEVDDPAGIALFLVSGGEGGVALRRHALQDGSSAAELTLTRADAIELLPAGPAFSALEYAVDIGIAAVCAEAVGVMDEMLDTTAGYLNTRQQFGVPIASFQALRHRVADVKMQLELARSMSYFASLKLGDLPPLRRQALAQAKFQLGNSMRFVGQQCIQLHGGIGVTDEYVVSHQFKRLTAIEMSFGDTLHQLGEVSARMRDTAGVFT